MVHIKNKWKPETRLESIKRTECNSVKCLCKRPTIIMKIKGCKLGNSQAYSTGFEIPGFVY